MRPVFLQLPTFFNLKYTKSCAPQNLCDMVLYNCKQLIATILHSYVAMSNKVPTCKACTSCSHIISTEVTDILNGLHKDFSSE